MKLGEVAREFHFPAQLESLELVFTAPVCGVQLDDRKWVGKLCTDEVPGRPAWAAGHSAGGDR